MKTSPPFVKADASSTKTSHGRTRYRVSVSAISLLLLAHWQLMLSELPDQVRSRVYRVVLDGTEYADDVTQTGRRRRFETASLREGQGNRFASIDF
jgi:hypothetical protein